MAHAPPKSLQLPNQRFHRKDHPLIMASTDPIGEKIFIKSRTLLDVAF